MTQTMPTQSDTSGEALVSARLETLLAEHQPGNSRWICSSVPCSATVGPAIIGPMPLGAAYAPTRSRSSFTTAA